MYYSFLTESEVENGLVFWLKNRNIWQKFAYVWHWCSAYYDAYPPKEVEIKESYTQRFLDFILPEIHKDESVAFISLWCWDSRQEHWMLKYLADNKYNVTYFWVDFSKGMLDLSWLYLKDINIKKRHIYWDFTKNSFNSDLSKLLSNYDRKIYFFLWGTFWNTSQTLITDTLYNLLHSWDLLLMDVLSRPSDSQKAILKIFRRYKSYLENEWMMDFVYTPLDLMEISRESWELFLETYSEDSVWAIVFSFWFMVNQKVVWSFWWDRFHLLPKEKIDLLNIRNYNISVFEHFMDEHEFKLAKKWAQDISDVIKRYQFMRTVNK